MKNLLIVFIALTALSCSAQNKKEQAGTKQPNVVFFLVDDLGWKDLGYRGSDFYETPEIDKIANESMRFSQAYAAHPRCVPSRYAMITGQFPARFGSPGRGESQLKKSEFTIAESFKEAGYTTFFAGKWHLAGAEVYPEDQGFDYNYGGGHAGAPRSYFQPYNERKNGYKGNGKEKLIEGLDDAEAGTYLTDHLTDKTVDFIKANKDKPFFVYLSHYGVHTPFESKEELKNKYDEKLAHLPKSAAPEFIVVGDTGQTKTTQDNSTYAGMIESVDQSFGRITKVLEELGLDKNTIIVFTSDHGGLSNRGNKRPLATSNLPLRAGKGHNYEGGIRIPMFVKWPGITTGTDSDHLVTGTDYFPTLLHMAELKARPDAHLDGRSFAPVLKGEELDNTERPIFWHSPVPRPVSTGDRANTTVRLGDYKLMDFYEENRIELYNIKNDIGETTNLSESMPEKRDELLKLVVDWRKEVKAFVKKNKKNKNIDDY